MHIYLSLLNGGGWSNKPYHHQNHHASDTLPGRVCALSLAVCNALILTRVITISKNIDQGLASYEEGMKIFSR